MSGVTAVTDRTGRIGALRTVAAELVRAKGSASWYFVIAGAAISLVQGAGWWSVTPPELAQWRGLLGWQTMYATGLLAPLMALLVSVVARREQAAREGATWTRPVSLARTTLARFVVMAGQSALFHVGLVLPLVGVGLLKGLQHPPILQLGTMVVVLWATSLLPLAAAMLVSRRLGMVACVGIFVVWQVAGTLAAETAGWWAQPWSWAVHAAMPVLQVHANGVGLEPGSPVHSWNPLWPVLAGLVLTCFMMILASSPGPVRSGAGRVRGRGRSDGLRSDREMTGATAAAPLPAGTVTGGRPHRIWAQVIVLKSTGIYPLLGLAAATLVGVGMVWDAAYAVGVACWVLLPCGTAVMAVLAWKAHADAWRVTALRCGPGRLSWGLTLLCCVFIAGLTVLTGLVVGATGGGPRHLAVTMFTVGWAGVLANLWLTARWGAAMALGVTLTVLVLSLVFGASTLSSSGLWIVGVYGWPLNATTTQRATLVTVVAVLLGVMSWAGWRGAAVRAARH